ncbi:hypothetical protein RA274_28455, partial [Pseudomonas syringae pv. tagetis]|uniref:hypothetical protein n=1 Tax=Pseudomonas syringae group genomosp. 7 TaxID=251699 RepID=UPI00377038D3
RHSSEACKSVKLGGSKATDRNQPNDKHIDTTKASRAQANNTAQDNPDTPNPHQPFNKAPTHPHINTAQLIPESLKRTPQQN